MKINPQRPRSCLGWFAWIFGILLLLFAISYAIDMARLANAWREADALAARLGYTPERHLADLVGGQINPVIGSSRCEVEVFFTTPLNPADLASYSEQAGAYRARGNPTDGRNMYTQLPFIVNGGNIDMFSRDQIEELPSTYEQYWFVNDAKGQIKTTIFYSEFSQANVKIEYAGRPITENVAYVGVNAGIFPIWIQCKNLWR